jgi:hypothetical protein
LSLAELFSASRRHSAAYCRYFSASSITSPKSIRGRKCLEPGTWNFRPKFRIKSARAARNQVRDSRVHPGPRGDAIDA